jgi:hypothetical protein
MAVYEHMFAVYSNAAFWKCQMKYWSQQFELGRESIKDDPCLSDHSGDVSKT